MSLSYDFKKAIKTLHSLPPDELKSLESICGEIREAQDNLTISASELLKKCANSCKGLCCRNIYPDTIINYWDFLFILTLDTSYTELIRKCLKNETLFSSDCIFLENGKGPCIFPAGIKPKICIMTFCGDILSIKKELRLVGSKFNKLARFFYLRKPRALKNFLIKCIRS